MIDLKGPLAQSEASKSRIKDLFKDILDEFKGFKHQITIKQSFVKQTQRK